MLKITHTALSTIKKEILNNPNEGTKPMVRLFMGIGWGGPQLRLAQVESALENDEITEENGIRFLVNEKDKAYLNNVKIDYVKSTLGDGQFKVITL